MPTPLQQVVIILHQHPSNRALIGKDGSDGALILTAFLCPVQSPSLQGHCLMNFLHARLCPED